MTDLPDIATLDEAAEFLRIERRTLLRLASGPKPKIGSLRQGRRLTFPRAVIEAYVEANTTRAAPPNPFGLTDASLRRIREM